MTSHRDFAPVPDLTAANSLVNQAGESAKRQLDHEIVEAKTAIEKLLDDIVLAARNDNPEVLQKWKEQRMRDFERSSKTSWAYELFETQGGLSTMLNELRASTKPSMTEMKRINPLSSKKELKMKSDFKPNGIWFQAKIPFWQADIKAQLVRLSRLILDTRPTSDQLEIVKSWFKEMEDHLKDHVAISGDADVAGMQVRYELWRLVKLVHDGNPPFFRRKGGITISHCFELDEVLKRVRAWHVPSGATQTSNSLNKRQMGLRAAGIYGVPHRAAF